MYLLDLSNYLVGLNPASPQPKTLDRTTSVLHFVLFWYITKYILIYISAVRHNRWNKRSVTTCVVLFFATLIYNFCHAGPTAVDHAFLLYCKNIYHTIINIYHVQKALWCCEHWHKTETVFNGVADDPKYHRDCNAWFVPSMEISDKLFPFLLTVPVPETVTSLCVYIIMHLC